VVSRLWAPGAIDGFPERGASVESHDERDNRPLLAYCVRRVRPLSPPPPDLTDLRCGAPIGCRLAS